jgi:hypothetical protein
MCKKGSGPFVRDLLQEKKYDFVCVEETIIKDFDEKNLRRFDPNRSYLWDWIPAKEKSGGLLSGFSVDRFDVGGRVQEGYILLHKLWDKKMEAKWNVMNVYEYPHDKDKEKNPSRNDYDVLSKQRTICNGWGF